MRQRRRAKAKVKSHNMSRRKRQRTSFQHNSYSRGRTYVKPRETANFSSDFRIIENTETVIRELNHVLTCRGKRQEETLLYLNIARVISFDLGSLTCLLSTLRFTKNYIGNEPSNAACKKYFEESGFLDWMRSIDGRKFPKSNSNNLIFEKGVDKTSNARVGREIRKAIKYLTGKENTFPPVYSIIQEICPNSIEHANVNNKDRNWLMGIRYEFDKVCFAMVDKGQGILRTLKRKPSQVIGDTFSDDVNILLRAFGKKYQSASDDDNRNKGLPRIKSVCDEGLVNNMTVITNSTMLNLSDSSKSKRLGAEFAGTFYYWEITNENYYRWKSKTKNTSV